MYVNAYPPLRMLIMIVIFRIVEPLIWLLIFSPFWGGGGHRGQSIFKTFYSKKWQVKYCCHKINEKENIEICYYMCMKINKVVTLTQITGAKKCNLSFIWRNWLSLQIHVCTRHFYFLIHLVLVNELQVIVILLSSLPEFCGFLKNINFS